MLISISYYCGFPSFPARDSAIHWHAFARERRERSHYFYTACCCTCSCRLPAKLCLLQTMVAYVNTGPAVVNFSWMFDPVVYRRVAPLLLLGQTSFFSAYYYSSVFYFVFYIVLLELTVGPVWDLQVKCIIEMQINYYLIIWCRGCCIALPSHYFYFPCLSVCTQRLIDDGFIILKYFFDTLNL